MREDIELKSLAEELGFEAKVSNKGFWKEGVPYDAYSFVKGNVHVWEVRDGWRIAEAVDNRFTNHQTIATGLEDALNKANSIIENT